MAIADFLFTFALSRTVSELIRDYSDFVYDTGSDVTTLSPPGGVTSQIKWQIPKGNCRLPICD